MLKHLIREESGMTLSLAMIMIALIGVMGAGLLTFVVTDVGNMAQTNRGQQALEVADAGVQAAKQQLITDNTATTNYDGGTDDLPWSYCFNITPCSASSPTATGSTGMTLNIDAGSAKVTILKTGYSPDTFRVISDGQAGDARRKIEAFIRSDADVTFPRTYLTRTNLNLSGSINPSAISFFALGNVTLTNNVNLGNENDRYYGRWAQTTGVGPYPNSAGSYPNDFNATARSTSRSGVAARGSVTLGNNPNPSQALGARVFGSNTTPAVVPDYYASSLAPVQKIAFPFYVPTDQEDRQELDVLRQRALSQETSSNPLYMDSSPGNKVDDTGMPNRTCSFLGGNPLEILGGNPLEITSWPSGSNYDTVRFYEFQTYNACNAVTYHNAAANADCNSTASPPKGVIAVENGDFVYNGNRRFNGGVIVRAYSNGVSIPEQGKFTAEGNPCLKGYANSGGTMSISGNISLGDVPELASQASFRGGMEQVSWRELYE